MTTPAHWRGVGDSRSQRADSSATMIGCVLTRMTDAATLVRLIDAFHDQKCSARSVPAPSATKASRRDRRAHCRHPRQVAKKGAIRSSDSPRRQTAMVRGGSCESRTRGPAKENASKAIARTVMGERETAVWCVAKSAMSERVVRTVLDRGQRQVICVAPPCRVLL
jgi:hypothetical protein